MVRAVVGAVSIAAVTAFVTGPLLLPVLVAFVLVGYAATVTAQIRRVAARTP
jgi:hypothetical protein